MVDPLATQASPSRGEDISYRLATAADASALAAFAARAFSDTFAHLYPPEDLAAFLAKSYGEAIQRQEIADSEIATWLALQGSDLIGYAQAGPVDMKVECGKRDRELYRLYVATQAKGAGVSHKLMRNVLGWARSGGADALRLSVWENNARAQTFYRRYGFKHVGEHKFMVGNTADHDFIWRLGLNNDA